MNVVDKIASIQPFDWAVVGFIVLMFVLGYAQGIIRRLLGIAAISFSFLLAANLRDTLGGFLAQYWTQWPKEYSYMLAFGFLFTVLTVVFALITESFYKRAQVFPNAPVLDEVIGGLLGILQALVLVGILIVILDSAFKAPVAIGRDQIAFIEDVNGAVTGSATAAVFRDDVLPYVVALAGPLLPTDLHGIFPLP